MIQVKLQKDGQTLKYISLIRKLYPQLAMGTLKQCIEQGKPILELDEFDCDEEWDEEDETKHPLLLLSTLLRDLDNAGASLELFVDEEPVSLEFIGNHIESCLEIGEQVDRDIMCELDCEE